MLKAIHAQNDLLHYQEIHSTTCILMSERQRDGDSASGPRRPSAMRAEESNPLIPDPSPKVRGESSLRRFRR
jgi:hypothetical protein